MANKPSLARAMISACAEASPTARPAAILAAVSEISAKEALNAVSNVDCWEGK